MKYIEPAKQFEERITVHPSQRQIHVHPVGEPLYVITVITNPQRYYSRYRLYQAFEKMCADAGAILYTVEIALRDRQFEITSHDNPHHVQLRSPSEIWLKECGLNIALSKLPPSWAYVAWVDADLVFSRADWVNETIHQLQSYSIVQMWSHAQDLSPDYDLGPNKVLSNPAQSFMYSYVNGVPLPPFLQDKKERGSNSGYYGDNRFHPGYAWAARRSAISDLGGFGDIGLLGAGDHHIAAALIGKVQNTIPPGMQPSYGEYWMNYQEQAETHIRRNVGYVSGMILHGWHSKKANRFYNERWKILVEEKYDHLLDIKKDPQGIYKLTNRNYKLRDRLRQYFKMRNEDSIEL